MNVNLSFRWLTHESCEVDFFLASDECINNLTIKSTYCLARNDSLYFKERLHFKEIVSSFTFEMKTYQPMVYRSILLMKQFSIEGGKNKTKVVRLVNHILHIQSSKPIKISFELNTCRVAKYDSRLGLVLLLIAKQKAKYFRNSSENAFIQFLRYQ